MLDLILTVITVLVISAGLALMIWWDRREFNVWRREEDLAIRVEEQGWEIQRLKRQLESYQFAARGGNANRDTADLMDEAADRLSLACQHDDEVYRALRQRAVWMRQALGEKATRTPEKMAA